MNRPIKFILIIAIIAGFVGCTEFSRVTVTSTLPLPPSLKGYELYSWHKGDDWYFTLITGTNRIKTSAEITSQESIFEEDGWVKITVIGLQELLMVLDRLPSSEQIYWLNGKRLEYPEGISVFAFPPGEVAGQVRRHSDQRGLELNIVQ